MYDVKGKSIQDILNMDVKTFNNLTTPELRKVVGRLVSAGNKRLRRAEKAGITSPAHESVKESGGMFSAKGKTHEQLKAEFMRAKAFLKSPTSTQKGAKKFAKDMAKRLKEKGVEGVSESNVVEVIKRIHDMKEDIPQFADIMYKDSTKKIYEKYRKGKISFDEMNEMLKAESESAYEKKQEQSADVDVSRFFEI